MKIISLKLPEELISESFRHSTRLHVTRAEYIRIAIERMNQGMEKELRAERMQDAARRCGTLDIEVNREFESSGCRLQP
jgi:Arc/MetJ-type ribon-helix-helix transcriptional regulator